MKHLFTVFLFLLCLLAHSRGSVEGHYVRLELSHNYLHVAEVEVFSGGKNIALKKTTTQSSNPYNLAAGLAVDGNTDGNADNGSIIHTSNSDNEWWEVDLGGDYPIDSIAIYNRTDHPEIALPRIIGCTVRVLNARRESVWDTKITDGLEKYVFVLNKSAKKSIALANRSEKDQPLRSSEDNSILIYADGDSVTAYPNNYTGSYSSLIADCLPEAGAVTVVNVAVSGQPQSAMLERLRTNVLSKNPDIVTLCTSLNDINLFTGGVAGQATGKAGLIHNITSYVDQVLATTNATGLRPQLILMTDNFAGQALDQKWARPYKDQYNTAHAVLEAFNQFRRNPSVHIVDNFTSFYSLGIDSPQLFSNLIDDHVHPNLRGYAIIRHNLENALIEAARRVTSAKKARMVD